MTSQPDTTDHLAAAVAAIDLAIDEGRSLPTLASLGRIANVAPAQLRMDFLMRMGLTPKAYADGRRAQQLRDALAAGAPVTDALFQVGYGSTSRVYEHHGDLLGMTPAAYRKGAPGETIRYAMADSSLGRVIVGLAGSGVCFVAFGEGDEELLGELAARFSRAEVAPASRDDTVLVAAVVDLIDDPGHASDLPLDVRGTAFQQRVWRALTRIAPGETVTYAELARRIGSPAAVRAVAQACGANPVAVAVPCHRVVGSDGSLTGYRWGVDRKRELLRREHAGVGSPSDGA